MNKTATFSTILGSLVVVAFVALFFISHKSTPTIPKTSSNVIHIVAAENFWGSLAAQLGGTHVEVLSIVSDPNADPHEYESNTTDAQAMATADYVIVNGAGYDSWADKLLSASTNTHRKVLNVATLLGKKEGDNPHFWYNPASVNQVVIQMTQDLSAIALSDASYYQQRSLGLQAALQSYQNHIAKMKQQYGGTTVAATEDIFTYLAEATGLKLISPSAFIQAVGEGNDPPTQSVIQFQQQLKSGQVHVLVYNQQTVTPITEQMKKIATDNGIPIVGITETIQPPDAQFQDWMNAELLDIENSLKAKATTR